MKKSLLLLAATVAIATGCQKTEMAGRPEILGKDSPLSFTAEVGKTTKAIFNDTQYENETFGMFAYALADDETTQGKTWENNKSLSNPVMGDNTGAAPVEVALTGGAWRANDGNSYFWPNATSTSISFFGYSPYYDETSATAYTQIPGVKLDLDKGITITDYVNNADRAKVVDLMYTTPQLDKKYTSSDVVLGKLPVVFNHALTQIAFTVKRFAQYNGVSIKVQNIKLVDIPSKGTFKSIVDENNIDDENWEISTDAADLLDYVIYDGGAAPQEVTTVKTDIGIAHLMLPQEAALLNFEVTYSISGTGVATETVTKQLTMGTLWDLNQRISYNLVIGLNEITFAPSITDWDVVDNINEYHVQASASTEEAINQAFNGLNKIKEDLLNETPANEDQCSFTVSVPAGATGDIALELEGEDFFDIFDIITLKLDNLGSTAPTFKPIFGWDVVTVPEELVAGAPAIVALVKVDYTPYQKAASASQLDINAALEDLNKSRATYTDVESAYRFVLDVPAGSTGNIALAFATPDAFGYGDQIKLRLDAVGTADADGNYDPASIPAFTTITGGWSMSVSPTPLVAGEKGVVLLTKNPL